MHGDHERNGRPERKGAKKRVKIRVMDYICALGQSTALGKCAEAMLPACGMQGFKKLSRVYADAPSAVACCEGRCVDGDMHNSLASV